MEQTSKKAEILWVNTMFLIATPVLAATLVPWYIHKGQASTTGQGEVGEPKRDGDASRAFFGEPIEIDAQ